MRRNYKLKKTITMKKFIEEFSESFSEHMKKRLMELEVRTVLTRNEDKNILDIKHVEHTKYDCDSKDTKKEYVYGKLIVVENILYFADSCTDNAKVMQSPVVDTIYNSLDNTGMILYENVNCKKVDDSNIDFVVDSLLSECPDVSERYIKIVREMLAHEKK